MYNPQLETFIKVAQAGSFSKASADLYITPTAVIKQINLLEQKLDLKLFIRTHRGLKLTKAGESLYKDAKYLIKYSKESLIRARLAEKNTEEVIRIGTSPMTPAQFLIDLFPKINLKYPNIKFQLIPFENTPENAKEILQNLGDNIDLVAGIFDDDFLITRKCSALKLFDVCLCCGVSVRHKLATKTKLSVEDLADENLMMIGRGWNCYIDELRENIILNHSEINIIDFDFYNLDVFNLCENENNLVVVSENFLNVHPLLKILPVNWGRDYKVPFGLLHANKPTENVQLILDEIEKIEK